MIRFSRGAPASPANTVFKLEFYAVDQRVIIYMDYSLYLGADYFYFLPRDEPRDS